jgi:single-strand DNA-binding protein
MDHEDQAMDAAGEWANEVRLVGRVSAEAVERELPSGDAVASLRLVVPRASRARTAKASGRGAGVDTIDVSCWTARTRRTARGLAPGDVIAVEGALRRRFFRSGTATASRYEVEATAVRRTG